MRNLLLIGVLIFSPYFSYSVTQANPTHKEVGVKYNEIEDFILALELDSANILLSEYNTAQDPYLSALKKVASSKFSYKELYEFILSIDERYEDSFFKMDAFLSKYLKEPTEEKINLFYVKIRWLHVIGLLNIADLDEAAIVNNQLEKYILQFEEGSEDDVLKAKMIATTYSIVLNQIQGKVEEGKKICLDNNIKAHKLKDTTLIVFSLYYLCDFLLMERDLEGYISTSEKCLELERKLEKKTLFYFPNLMNLIDAYIYKGGNNEQASILLEELYATTNYRLHSFSLYVKYIGANSNNPVLCDNIFKKFKVKGLIAFCDTIVAQAESGLNTNDCFRVYYESSRTLAKFKYYKKAIEYRDECISLTKKNYSTTLAESLAKFEIEKAKKEKEFEVHLEKEKKDTFVLLTIALVLILLILVFAFFKNRRQTLVLAEKNDQIKKSLVEKQLLLKEIHHRVKNNFQIVSGLLELQTNSVDDEGLKQLAIESQSRINSMAIIHQKLYENDNLIIYLEDYLKKLVEEINKTFSIEKIDLNILVDKEYSIDTDTAIPLGLIVNELLTNSFKYAYKNGDQNHLSIELLKGESNHQLIIKDNGKGLPDDFDFKTTKSLGLRLVSRLAKQLHGKIDYKNEGGAIFTISFKETHLRELVD